MLATLAAALGAACAADGKVPPEAARGLAVSWSGGFSLPALLARPREARSLSDIGAMLDEQWYAPFAVTVAEQPDRPILLTACTDYLSRRTQGVQPVSEMERAPFMELAVMCRAAAAMRTAMPSRQTFLDRPPIHQGLPALLPAALAMIPSESEREVRLLQLRVARWAEANLVTRAERVGADAVRFTHEQGAQEIALVARGDFDGDGIEDLLLVSRDSTVDGSYGATRLFLLGRTRAGAPYRLIMDYAD